MAAFTSLIHLSCQNEGGFVSPKDERNLRPLGEFVGKAVEGDPAFKGRAIHLVNPKVVIQWRAVGLKDKITLSPQKAINAVTPYNFSLNVTQPPPEEISSASEIAFGIVSLFSDDNGNGTFDRLMHPDYAADFTVIDSLSKDVVKAQADLLAISEIKARRPVTERYFLDAPGILTTADKEVPDTVRFREYTSDPKGWADYLTVRQSILGNRNRWELFFARRKKDNEYYWRQYPVMGHAMGAEIRYDRALYPKRGHEGEFEGRLRESHPFKVRTQPGFEPVPLRCIHFRYHGLSVYGVWHSRRGLDGGANHPGLACFSFPLRRPWIPYWRPSRPDHSGFPIWTGCIPDTICSVATINTTAT